MKQLLVLVLLLSASVLFASDITFSGGYTSVKLQEGNRTVTLSSNASVSTEQISITADSVTLYGKDYSTVNCSGNVNAVEKERGISLQCPGLFFDREKQILISDGWIEIQDIQNEASLSGARLEYYMEEGIITLQMMARILKHTSKGLMTCRADSIEFNNETQTVVLKGHASVVWGQDNYSATMITVNLTTEEISMDGSISGVVNG